MAASSDTKTNPSHEQGGFGDPSDAIVTADKPIISAAGHAATGSNSPDEAEEQAQQTMFRDIDAILARLESGIEAERTAVDAMLDRLTAKAA